jgi:hypothetical protein
MTMRTQVSLSVMGSCIAVHGKQAVPVRDGQWRAALTEALAPFSRADVQAQLGFDHARVAVMTVDRPGGLGSLPVAKQESFVQAWATDMLHVVPHEHVVRWRMLADTRKVLVSCVRREIVDDLGFACKEAGARLTSCRPAVLSVMESVRALPSAPITVVWTEGFAQAARHNAVQLLRFRARQLQRCWRGWLPADADIDTTVARFDASDETSAAGARLNIHWPAAAAA